MEIKIILVGMLIGCSYLVGEDISKRYIKRHKQLNDLIRVLEIMRMDLAFGMYTLEEIFRNIAVKDEYDFSEFSITNDFRSFHSLRKIFCTISSQVDFSGM